MNKKNNFIKKYTFFHFCFQNFSTNLYIKIRLVLGIDAKTIHEELTTALRPNIPSYRTVARWASRFREGREDINDDLLSARPISEPTDENIDRLSTMIHIPFIMKL